MVVLDTDIIVGLLKGNSEAIDEVRRLEENGESLSTTLITAYELMKGAYISSKPDENLARVQDSISTLRVLELSLVACEEAAKIYRQLKEKGVLIGEFDVLIAATAISNDEPLMTRDTHFRSIKGTRIIKW
ncbi:MAG: type II toxin-antitoxin system VapC family toxin [Nitrososphaerota archaeon]|nr:type II toxin-antitoxin system VapC family toxin [Nitrososphaerota archaeon]